MRRARAARRPLHHADLRCRTARRAPSPNLDAVEELLATCREELRPERPGLLRLASRPRSAPSTSPPRRCGCSSGTRQRQHHHRRAVRLRPRARPPPGAATASRRCATPSALGIEDGFRDQRRHDLRHARRDQEDLEASLRFAAELADLGARIHAHTFMPLPGTPWRDAQPALHPAETPCANSTASPSAAPPTATGAARPTTPPASPKPPRPTPGVLRGAVPADREAPRDHARVRRACRGRRPPGPRRACPITVCVPGLGSPHRRLVPPVGDSPARPWKPSDGGIAHLAREVNAAVENAPEALQILASYEEPQHGPFAPGWRDRPGELVPWLRTHLGTGWAHGRTQGSGGRAEAGRGVVVGRVRGRRGGGAGETGPDDLAAGRGPADAPIAAEGLDKSQRPRPPSS